MSQGKLGTKARWGVLLGYVFKIRGYRIWIPETDSIIESIDVSFDENFQLDLGHSRTVMDPEEGDLFPVCPANQNNRYDGVVEVVPEVIPGPSNGSNNLQTDGEEDS